MNYENRPDVVNFLTVAKSKKKIFIMLDEKKRNKPQLRKKIVKYFVAVYPHVDAQDTRLSLVADQTGAQ